METQAYAFHPEFLAQLLKGKDTFPEHFAYRGCAFKDGVLYLAVDELPYALTRWPEDMRSLVHT